MEETNRNRRTRRNRRGRRKKRGRRRKKIVTGVLGLIFAAVFLFSLGMTGKIYLQGKMEQKAFEDLAVKAEEISDDGKDVLRHEGTKYAFLKEENPDFAAWLTLEDTEIDYPVMYTPEEPEYYLYRAFDGTEAASGTLFIGENGSLDSDLFIIYGHNMKNGTMFGSLDLYQDKAYYKDHSRIILTTPEEEKEYEIFAALETRVLRKDEEGFRYYRQAGELDKKGFERLLQWLKDERIYDTGVTPTYGEQILILSTCSDREEDGRFLVVGKECP